MKYCVTISLVIIYALLLVAVSIRCYYNYTRYCKKWKHLQSYHDIDNKLKESHINNIIWKWVINSKIHYQYKKPQSNKNQDR